MPQERGRSPHRFQEMRRHEEYEDDQAQYARPLRFPQGPRQPLQVNYQDEFVRDAFRRRSPTEVDRLQEAVLRAYSPPDYGRQVRDRSPVVEVRDRDLPGGYFGIEALNRRNAREQAAMRENERIALVQHRERMARDAAQARRNEPGT